MGRFFKSKTKQSGYGQAADKTATSGKFSDFPTKIAKKIDTLQTKIDTIIDTHKAVGKSLPISKKNILQIETNINLSNSSKNYSNKINQKDPEFCVMSVQTQGVPLSGQYIVLSASSSLCELSYSVYRVDYVYIVLYNA